MCFGKIRFWCRSTFRNNYSIICSNSYLFISYNMVDYYWKGIAMHIEFSKKLRNTPPYLFVEIERKYEEAVREGIDIINMAIGDPDIPTPSFIIEKFNKFVWKPEFHRYPHYDGCFEFREEVSGYIKNRFNVDVSSEDEVVALLGARKDRPYISRFVDEGDFALFRSVVSRLQYRRVVRRRYSYPMPSAAGKRVPPAFRRQTRRGCPKVPDYVYKLSQ